MTAKQQPKPKARHKTLGLFGELTPESAKDLCIEMYDHKGPITLLISSEGGDSVAGMAVANMLRAHQFPTTAVVIGEACSAAVEVMLGADSVFAFENSSFMLHAETVDTVGRASELAAIARIASSRDEQFYQQLAIRTEKDIDWWRAKLAGKDLWLSADDAEELGLIDGIMDHGAVE